MHSLFYLWNESWLELCKLFASCFFSVTYLVSITGGSSRDDSPSGVDREQSWVKTLTVLMPWCPRWPYWLFPNSLQHSPTTHTYTCTHTLIDLLYFPPLPPPFSSNKINMGTQKDGNLAIIGHPEGCVHMPDFNTQPKNPSLCVHGLPWRPPVGAFSEIWSSQRPPIGTFNEIWSSQGLLLGHSVKYGLLRHPLLGPSMKYGLLRDPLLEHSSADSLVSIIFGKRAEEGQQSVRRKKLEMWD